MRYAKTLMRKKKEKNEHMKYKKFLTYSKKAISIL